MSEKGYKTIKFSDFDAFKQNNTVLSVDQYNFDFVQHIQERLIKSMYEYISDNTRKVARTLLGVDASQMSDYELDQHLESVVLGASMVVYWDRSFLFRYGVHYSYDGSVLTVKCRVEEYSLPKYKKEDK